jgi:hypothetical protein
MAKQQWLSPFGFERHHNINNKSTANGKYYACENPRLYGVFPNP